MLDREVLELTAKYDIDPDAVESAYYGVESAPKHRIYFTGADPDVEVQIYLSVDGSRNLDIYDYRIGEVPNIVSIYLRDTDGVIHRVESPIPESMTIREAVEWARKYRENRSK